MIKHSLMIAVGGLLLLTPCSEAELVSTNAESNIVADELKAQADPTILARRVWSDTEWNKYEDNSHDIEETVGGLWSWRLSAQQEWAVRLKLPYRWHVAGDTAGDSDENGLGDIKLATGTAFHLNESWRAGGGVEMRFPSATEDSLGANVWQPQLFGAVAWDVTERLTLSPSFEYNWSIDEENGAAPTEFLEMYFPATFILPRHWAVSAQYEAKVDFEAGEEWTHSAKVALSKQLESRPLGFSLSVKKSFDGGDKDFQLNFVTTYFFR